MIPVRIAAVLAIMSASQPLLAASLDLVADRPSSSGVAGKAYFRLPLGHAEAPRFGLKMAVARQDRDVAGFAQGAQREADAVDLRIALNGERSLALVGVPVTGRDALAATADGRKRFPWGTAALVAGGLVLAGGLYFAHLVHEAEKNSD